MGLLLDTCVIIWLAGSRKRVPTSTLELIVTEPSVFVSALSLVEISIKQQKTPIVGTSLDDLLELLVDENSFEILPFDTESCLAFDSLPMHHKDPFDRMLVSQALAHELTIITPDAHISQYEVATEW